MRTSPHLQLSFGLFSSIILLLFIFSSATTFSQTTNHTSYNCSSCHILHNAPGTTLTSVGGNALLCQSCHNTNGAASAKPFANADKAIPGISGTSHAWDVAAENTSYETLAPAADTEMGKRLPAGNIICSTCHNQHNNGSLGSPYLRIANTGDTMCKVCHAARDKGIYSDAPATNKGSHPVGITYNGTDSRFSPAPANTQLKGGKIECSSCHGIHDVQTPSVNNLTNDGNLLRMTNDANLCKDCHNYKDHNSMTCLDCHEVHNTVDGTIDSNIYMIKNTITVTTPASATINATVVFTSEGGTGNEAGSFADGAAPYDGVCEVCHTDVAKTGYHLNNSPGTHNNGTNCTTCHSHADSFSAGACNACHNTTQGTRRQIFAAGGDYDGTSISHHVGGTILNEDCVICHSMSTHKIGTVKLVDDMGTIYDYNSATPNSINNFCINCHDADGYGGDTTPFSDVVTVADIKGVAAPWSNASHNSSGLGVWVMAQQQVVIVQVTFLQKLVY